MSFYIPKQRTGTARVFIIQQEPSHSTQPPPRSDPIFYDKFATRVVTIRVSADTPPAILDQLADCRSLEGVILECKRAGNTAYRAVTGTSWIDMIEPAVQIRRSCCPARRQPRQRRPGMNSANLA